MRKRQAVIFYPKPSRVFLCLQNTAFWTQHPNPFIIGSECKIYLLFFSDLLWHENHRFKNFLAGAKVKKNNFYIWTGLPLACFSEVKTADDFRLLKWLELGLVRTKLPSPLPRGKKAGADHSWLPALNSLSRGEGTVAAAGPVEPCGWWRCWEEANLYLFLCSCKGQETKISQGTGQAKKITQ